MRRLAIHLAGIVLALAALAPALALGAQGITGTVTDGAGTALQGVTVSLSSESIVEALWRRTDSDGGYSFLDLAPGTYGLELRLAGYGSEIRSDVRVAADVTTIEDVVLRPVEMHTSAISVASGTASRITEEATVTAATAEGRPGDESASEITTVTTQADLTIASSDSVDPVVAGTRLRYVVTVTNHGPSHARYVEVTGTPSAGARFVSTTGCEEDPDGVPLCTLGEVEAGASKQFLTTVDVGSGVVGAIRNLVSVSAQTMEVKPGDEAIWEETAVDSRADLAIRIADSRDPVIAGTPLSYAVTVANAGPSDARDVVLIGTPPDGTTVVSMHGCLDDSPQLAACALGTIPAGSSKQVTVSLEVAPGTTGVLSHQASVASQTVEANPGNEASVEDTTVATAADLVIAETGSADEVVAGTPLTYIVAVSNLGPSDAREVVVTGDLPDGATLDATAGCAEDPAGFPSCGLGTLAAGETRRYRVTLAVNSAATGAVATRSSVISATPEANPGDESAARKTPIDTRADLVVASADSVDPVVAGMPLTYTVTVHNNGPSDARDVAVRGTLPTGVRFDSTTGCTEDGAPGGGIPTCSLGTIVAGSSKQYAIEVWVHPGATGALANQATATSSTAEGHPGDESTPGPPRLTGDEDGG